MESCTYKKMDNIKIISIVHISYNINVFEIVSFIINRIFAVDY